MGARPVSGPRRHGAAAAALLLLAGVLALLAPAAARADSAPPAPSPATPVTAAADALPTVQINGVAWAQVVVGNVVYVTGSFTSARPAGSPAGTNETPRSNLLAYDIRTGVLLPTWAPTLNAQGLAIAASPDGSRIYVGGDFNTANGVTRNRVAAFDATTGALIGTWHPSVNSQVRAIAATADTVYLGGSITAVGGVSRTRLAAVRAADGGLLPWAPVTGVGPTSGNRDGNTATSDQVLSLVVTGGGSQVVASGRFYTLNGVLETGIGALDATTGATNPFAVGGMVTNQGVNSAIYSVTTDGTNVYATGYDYYGPGNLEGNLIATANGGSLVEVNPCNGDTYSSYPTGGLLYVASHTHQCQAIGGFPEQPTRLWKHATVFTTGPTTSVRWGTNVTWVGKPAGTQLPWFPDLAIGSYTGQYQAGWSVTGSGPYVAYGGEFPSVNGTAQQGLVRFALPSAAPNKVGPIYTGFTTTATATGPGTARVAWTSTSDPDNEYLTYRVYRDSTSAAPVFQETRPSQWWNLPVLGWTDPAAAGSHRYKVTATDPFGNSTASPWSATIAVGAGSQPGRPYVATVAADGATDHWALDEPGSTAYSDLGGTDLAKGSGVSAGAAGAIAGDPDTAATFNGTSSGVAIATSKVNAPNTFSLEAWFATTSTAGGKIIGFGNASTGTSTQYDRHVYLDGAGRVYFGVDAGSARRTLSSAAGLNDGRWHSVVATMGSGGMSLYVDGTLRGSRADTTFGLDYDGFWRVGGDATWAGAQYLSGRLDEVAVYPTALSAAQVANHNAVGRGGASNTPPTARFTSTTSGLTASVDGSTSTDPDGTVASWAWTFGDGGTATGAKATHTYAAGGTYPVTLTVTDDKGATGTTTQQLTVTAPPVDQPPVAAFTSTVSGATASLDGTSSADPDGTIASYAWAFGDGATGTGATTSHAYAAGGTYTVTLTVTDNSGATGTVSHPVTATAGTQAIAADAFGRTVSGGFGTADLGGAWTTVNGAARESVTPGAGVMGLSAAGNLDNAFLQGVSQTSADVFVKVSFDSLGTGSSGTYAYVTARRVSASNDYRARVRVDSTGGVYLTFSRLSTDTGTAVEGFPGGEVKLAGITYAPGAVLDVRVRAYGVGTTTLQASVWADGTPEPATPQRSTTDTTAGLQAAGGLGLAASLPSSATAGNTVRFAGYSVTAAG